METLGRKMCSLEDVCKHPVMVELRKNACIQSGQIVTSREGIKIIVEFVPLDWRKNKTKKGAA